MAYKAIFLDRDGVLNDAVVKDGKPYPPDSIETLIVSEEVLPALLKLKSLGYLLIGATNQPDVARGKTQKETVEKINHKLMSNLPLDEIRVCYHDNHDLCHCRKPFPGLLIDAANERNINLQESFMIGDRWKDIEAGQKAGCKTVWINYGYQEPHPLHPDFTAKSLKDAVEWISNFGA